MRVMPAAANSSARRGRAWRNACRGTGWAPAGSAARNVSANSSASRSTSSCSLAAAKVSKKAWMGSGWTSGMAAPLTWRSEEVGEPFQQRRGRGQLPAFGGGAAAGHGLDHAVDDGLLADGERRAARVGERHDRLAAVVGVGGSFDEPSLVQGADRRADGLGGDPFAVGELTGRGWAVSVQPGQDGQLGEGELIALAQDVQLAYPSGEPAHGQPEVVGDRGGVDVGHERTR